MTVPVALTHDFLAARAGGERVVSALAAGFPDAPIHTLIHDPKATFADLDGRDVRTSWLDHITPLRSRYRAAFPIAPLLWRATRIEADVTICSTSGLSHHVRTTGPRIVYCHSPARWIHDADNYLGGFGSATAVAAGMLRRVWRSRDVTAMRSADLVLANSRQIAKEVADIYDIDARVVPPASSFDLDGPVQPISGVAPGFLLAPMRPLAYKRFDVLVEAARRRPDLEFLQVGDGPNLIDLRESAPPNLTSVGSVSDRQLRWAYRHARAAVMTAAEDFGLVPLEAAAHGLTTVGPDARGLRDHDPATIEAYAHGSVEGFLAAIDRCGEPTGRPDKRRLGVDRFLQAMYDAVDEVQGA